MLAVGISVPAVFLFVGCATYQTDVNGAREALASNDPNKAAALLKPFAEKESRDQLVYVLDYATALQNAKRYQESAKQYLLAEKMTDILDYHSLSKVASSLILSEEMVQYKGEDFEKVLINGMNTFNYLELGELDDALVEAKRLNEKLYHYKTDAKRDYEQNPFAFYLSAVIWEADHKWDDAYIAYKSAYAVAPNYPSLHEDLIRSAMRAQRPEELAQWKQKFPEVKVRPEWTDRAYGEIVLVFAQGWGPRKQPRPDAPRFPMLVPVQSSTKRVRLVVDGNNVGDSTPIFSVQEVAIKTMNDDYARLIASRVAGTVTKAVLADQVRQRNKLLGAVAFLAMSATDRADLRQWSTLPQSFQFVRVFAQAGKYKVRGQGLDVYGSDTGEQMPERDVVVKPGQKTFLTWRSVR